MACKRITISLTEEQYDHFREVLPAKANISEVLADQIGMFVDATGKYGDDFILDVMCNRGGYSIQKNIEGKTSAIKSAAPKSTPRTKKAATGKSAGTLKSPK
ncbi:MAG TPA: hypothetical protein VIS94_16840 [Desulfomonilia bacterium]